MKATATLRGCLYLNWAIPRSELPAAPDFLSYEQHSVDGASCVMASAVLFHQHHLSLSALPLVRLSNPQVNVRLYVQDGEGVPSLWFRRMVVPAWMLPCLRLLGQPAGVGRFDFPPVEATPGEAGWRWQVRGDGELTVSARPGSPPPGPGPRFSSWEALTTYIRHRPRAYSGSGEALSRIDAIHPRTDPLPVVAEVGRDGLVARALDLAALPPLHSAFLCGEVPMSFELAPARVRPALPRAVVAADTARVAGAAPAQRAQAA